MYYSKLDWQPYHKSNLPVAIADWLLFPGSFMQRVKDKSGVWPTIKILEEKWQQPAAEEGFLLSVPLQSETLVREVLITLNEKSLMIARTVIPQETLNYQDELAELKNKSLGSVLFKDKNWQRSQFEIAKLNPRNSELLHIKNHTDDLWARRSQFFLKEKNSLLLTEIFLPSVFSLC